MLVSNAGKNGAWKLTIGDHWIKLCQLHVGDPFSSICSYIARFYPSKLSVLCGAPSHHYSSKTTLWHININAIRPEGRTANAYLIKRANCSAKPRVSLIPLCVIDCFTFVLMQLRPKLGDSEAVQIRRAKN